MMQVVIVAGGKGTRLSSITKNDIPKAMALLNGKPILEYQIEVLVKVGIKSIILIVGHLHEIIERYFGDGKKFDVTIQYIVEEEPLGTAGAFFYLKEIVEDDFFLVLGDLIFDVDLKRMTAFHEQKNANITLLVHPNSHPQDSDIVVLNNKSEVTEIHRKGMIREKFYGNLVNSGIYLISSRILRGFQVVEKKDLEKDLILPLIANHSGIYGYPSTEYVKDAGTPERFKEVEIELKNQIVFQKNLRLKQKCVFLDRDGTINKYVGFVTRPEQIELEYRAAEAISRFHNAGYLVIVITNQPVIARNLCGFTALQQIHNYLETLLGENGAYLDDIRYCPHHPDKGYIGEREEYKAVCDCRKPRIGLILECVEKYNIALNKSWFIGDTTVDIKTGKNAGTKTILLRTGEAGRDSKYDVESDYTADTLLDAAEIVIRST